MPGIKLSGALKIKRAATISDNAAAKRTMQIVKLAIKEGKLDQVLSIGSGIHKVDGQYKFRSSTITEIDEQIAKFRESKINEMQFAIDQMDLFSKYLKKKVESASNGYSAKMVLNFMESHERIELIKIILDEAAKVSADPQWHPGKFNNMFGGPETLVDRVDINIENQYKNQEIGV